MFVQCESLHAPLGMLPEVDCVWQTGLDQGLMEDAERNLFGMWRRVWLIDNEEPKVYDALVAFSQVASVNNVRTGLVDCSVHKTTRHALTFATDIPEWDDVFRCQPADLGDFDAPDECDLNDYEIGRLVGHVPTENRLIRIAATELVEAIRCGWQDADSASPGLEHMAKEAVQRGNDAVAELAAALGVEDPLHSEEEEEADD